MPVNGYIKELRVFCKRYVDEKDCVTFEDEEDV